MRRVLVIQTAFLGDVVLATPLLEALHAIHPDATIDLLVRKGNESLFTQHPFLHSVYTWDKSNHKWSSLLQLTKVFRSQKYDLVVNVQRFFTSGLITLLANGNKSIGFDKNPLSIFFTKKVKHELKAGLHEIDRNLQLLASISPSLPRFLPKLYPSPTDKAAVQKYQKQPYITIAPASVWATKQLPIHKWIELIQMHANKTIYILGGKSDINLAEAIKSQVKASTPSLNIINLAGQLNLLQSASLMKGAQMNYVNDSGPMHLASATNSPVTVFYCSTVPEFGFGPLSDNATILQVSQKLPCRPCGLHGYKKCPEKHFNCGNQIILP